MEVRLPRVGMRTLHELMLESKLMLLGDSFLNPQFLGLYRLLVRGNLRGRFRWRGCGRVGGSAD